MNALIYADECQRLEAHLDTIQEKFARQNGRDGRLGTAGRMLDVERNDVIRRLMHLDDLIGYDRQLAS